jgi:hypothetical protein
MGASRETGNIWWYIKKLFTANYKFKWRIKDFFRCFSNEYFWQDSFFTHWNRIIGCKIRGHRKTGTIGSDEDSEKRIPFCFNCYRKINK